MDMNYVFETFQGICLYAYTIVPYFHWVAESDTTEATQQQQQQSRKETYSTREVNTEYIMGIFNKLY